MMKKNSITIFNLKHLILFLFFTIVLVGCQTTDDLKDKKNETNNEMIKELSENDKLNLEITIFINDINTLMKNQEYYQTIANQSCQNLCNNNSNIGACSLCAFSKIAATKRISTITSDIEEARNEINDLLN